VNAESGFSFSHCEFMREGVNAESGFSSSSVSCMTFRMKRIAIYEGGVKSESGISFSSVSCRTFRMKAISILYIKSVLFCRTVCTK